MTFNSRLYKKLYTICVAMLLCIYVSGCAVSNKENFDNTINSYYGLKVDKLVDAWGVPDGSYQKEDKSYVYQWVQNRGSHHFDGASYPWIGAQSHAYAPWNHALWPAWHGGVFTSGIGMVVSRPMTLDRSCVLNIYANKYNIITNHRSDGAGCASE
jgi:hypothetical protein